jgi:ABC-type dipeptide/oligopeptide/nickel transport system permease subunit
VSASRPETESAGAGVAPHVSLRGEIAPLVEQALRRRVLVARLRRAKWGIAALGVMLAILASAVLAPWIAPADPLAVDIRHRLAPPAWMEGGSRQQPLGTDQIGRDLLSRVIYGGRVSLVIGVAAVCISASLGVLLGLGAGYFGGRLDAAIMTLVNVMLSFPFVLLALAVVAVLGASLLNMIAVLGVAGWPIYARVVRAETLAIREREFVTAGRALGMSHRRILFGQILPNLRSVIVVIATLQVAQVIILESFLSFLGLGVQPPTPAWGNMLGEGRVYLLNSWWIAAFPGLAIFVTTLTINLLGNALRDWLDPQMTL